MPPERLVRVDMHGLDLGTTPAVVLEVAEHDELAHADGTTPDVGDPARGRLRWLAISPGPRVGRQIAGVLLAGRGRRARGARQARRVGWLASRITIRAATPLFSFHR